jgi:hypothetical protein
MDGSPKVYFVSIFFDGCSKQAAVTKIQILVASLILGVLIVDNETVSLCRGENTIRLTRFSCFSSPKRH